MSREVKNSKQLYKKLMKIYTLVIICVVSALTLYFISSMRNRFLERNLNDMHRLSEEALDYLMESKGIADDLYEELYQSEMKMNDLLHYLKDDAEAYQKYRLDTYYKFYLGDYKGIEDFATGAFERWSALKRLVVVSYSKGDMTYYTGAKKGHYSKDVRVVLNRIKDKNLSAPGEFSFLKEIRDPVSMQSFGALIVTFNVEKYERLLKNYSNAELVLYNPAGGIIYDSEGDLDADGLETARRRKSLNSELKAYVEDYTYEDYRLIGYLKRHNAAEIPVSVMIMIVGVGFMVMTAAVLLVRLYLHRLSARLNHILDGMTQVMGGDLNVRLETDKNGDELDVISAHFNEMCQKLDIYIQKSYLAEIEQKNAEMSALQSQINPHFLYNTLEAIRMKAICNGDREVGKMLYSMAVTFRSQIKEADVITLAQELHYCKKYLELFEYRYPNQFQAEVECPVEFMSVPIIKFVLQPIIENYFIHGIRMGDQENFLHIYVEKEEPDRYKIVVEDNGRGMSHEELERKNKQLTDNKPDKTKSIGISNVNRRMKAVYGQEYGIQMEAGKEGGLRVILSFRPDEVRDDEESNDCGR